MKKRYQEPKWVPRSSSDGYFQKTPIIERYTNYVSLVRKFVIELGLIGLMILSILGLFLFGIEVFHQEIILDPIEVPEDIEKLGYTGIVVAEQLADAALNIELEIRELSAQSSWHKETNNLRGISTNTKIPDISVPGAQFSIRFLARFIRQEFGLNSIYLRGELVHENNDLVLTLRNLSAANIPVVRVSNNGKGIEQLFPKGGNALLKLTNPSATAIYAYHKFSNILTDSANGKIDYEQSVDFFKYCLKFPPTTDDKLAYILWGATLGDLNRPEEAIVQFRKAIDLDPNYALAYNNWGLALGDLNRPEEAIKQFQKAIGLDPKFAGAYYWSSGLLNLKRPKEAK